MRCRPGVDQPLDDRTGWASAAASRAGVPTASSAGRSAARRSAISSTTLAAFGGHDAVAVRHAGAASAARRPASATLGPQALQQLGRQAGVDRQGGPIDAPLQIVDGASDEQGGAGIEQDDVAPGTRLAAQDGIDGPGVLVGRAAGELGRGRALEPELGRVDLVALDRVGET